MHPNSQVRAAAALPYISLQKVTFEQWLEFLRNIIPKDQMPSAIHPGRAIDPFTSSHREAANGKFKSGIYQVHSMDTTVTSFFDYPEVPEGILMVVLDNGSVRVTTDLSDPEKRTFVQPLLGTSGQGSFFNWGDENVALPLNLDKFQVELETSLT